MSILSPTGLEKIDYTQPGWNHIMTKNFQIVNYILQKVSRLADVDMHDLSNKRAAIGWDTTRQKWRPLRGKL